MGEKLLKRRNRMYFMSICTGSWIITIVDLIDRDLPALDFLFCENLYICNINQDT